MRKIFAILAIATLFTFALGAWAATPVSPAPVPDEATEVVAVQAPVPAEAAARSADAFFASLAPQAQSASINCSEVIGASCSPDGAVITCTPDFLPEPLPYPLTCWCYRGFWLCGI